MILSRTGGHVKERLLVKLLNIELVRGGIRMYGETIDSEHEFTDKFTLNCLSTQLS